MKTKDEIQDDCFKEIVNHRRCSAALSMGTGKTLLGLKHMAHFHKEKDRFLVVAPKKAIFQSWIDDAIKFGMQDLLPYIDFTTYLSLVKQDFRQYVGLYLDECHSIKENMAGWLSAYKGRILGLTGTPPRHSYSEKGRMIEMFCPIVYRYKTDDAIDDQILNDYRITIHLVTLSRANNMLIRTKTGKQWYTSEQENYNYWTKRIDQSFNDKIHLLRIQRMRAMMNFNSKEEYAKMLFNSIEDKCIIFANSQEQAERLCKDSYHSKNPDSEENLERLKAGTINKLSAVLQLNEGVNVPNLKSCIIMHSYSSNTKTAQRLGRILRLNPDQVANVHILVYKDTIDVLWTKEALKEFDEQKISYREAI